jgi:hypothetical protein
MKHRLLSLDPLYQSLDRVKRRLIGGSGNHALVVLDLAVEFDAPVTHCIPPFLAMLDQTRPPVILLRRKQQFCFNAPRHFWGNGRERITLQRTRIGPRPRWATCPVAKMKETAN